MEFLTHHFKEEIRMLIREEINLCQPEEQPESQPMKDIRNQVSTCEFLGITEPTIIRWRNKGKIPFMRIGSAVRYDINKVLEALESDRNKLAG